MNKFRVRNRNVFDLTSWSAATKKSARRIYQGYILLGMTTVFLYIHSYEAIRLLVLGETETILAMLTQGLLLLIAVSVGMLCLSPFMVGIFARRNEVKKYVNQFEFLNRFIGTPLSATVSISVVAFLVYGGLTGTLLFFFGSQSFGILDYTVLLAAIPLGVAFAYPIGFLVLRGMKHHMDLLRAQA